jgi:hypothetical protein
MGFFDKLFGKKDSVNQPENKTTNVDKPSDINVEYQNKLFATKEFYPFERWRNNYNAGLEQYTKENCNKTKKVFDDLLTHLVEIGEGASEAQKIELYKIAILKTNQLNDEIDGLIETEEREELCELTNKISIASGIEPKNYGAGEGLASEWREW